MTVILKNGIKVTVPVEAGMALQKYLLKEDNVAIWQAIEKNGAIILLVKTEEIVAIVN